MILHEFKSSMTVTDTRGHLFIIQLELLFSMVLPPTTVRGRQVFCTARRRLLPRPSGVSSTNTAQEGRSLLTSRLLRPIQRPHTTRAQYGLALAPSRATRLRSHIHLRSHM